MLNEGDNFTIATMYKPRTFWQWLTRKPRVLKRFIVTSSAAYEYELPEFPFNSPGCLPYGSLCQMDDRFTYSASPDGILRHDRITDEWENLSTVLLPIASPIHQALADQRNKNITNAAIADAFTLSNDPPWDRTDENTKC